MLTSAALASQRRQKRLEMVVERWSSEMDEAAVIAIAIAFKHSHTSQRPSQAVHTERTRPGR
eukprot:2633910-Prymnesium_polylepis.1